MLLRDYFNSFNFYRNGELSGNKIEAEEYPRIGRETRGVRHEIRPIRMRCLISGFRAQEHQSGEVSLLKISLLTKSVTFFFRLKFVSKLEEQISLMLVRLLLKLKYFCSRL